MLIRWLAPDVGKLCAPANAGWFFRRFILGCTLHRDNPEIPGKAGGGKSTGEAMTAALPGQSLAMCLEQLSANTIVKKRGAARATARSLTGISNSREIPRTVASQTREDTWLLLNFLDREVLWTPQEVC
jgi:hypothetical protein